MLHVQARRPPVGGGRHEDEEDHFPAAQGQQATQVQEGTEGSKVSLLLTGTHIYTAVNTPLAATGCCDSY